MRRVIGYEGGRPLWSDNEPGGYARTSGHAGELVVSNFDEAERIRNSIARVHERGGHDKPVANCRRCAA